MKELVEFFSKINNYIFNGFSSNKLYYFLPVGKFFNYKISAKEKELLEKNGIRVGKNKITGYYELYKLLKKIDLVLEKEILDIFYIKKNVVVIFNYKKLQENKVLKKIENIFSKNNGEQYFEFLIHGSYADGENTPSSDVDDILFIKKDVLKTYNDFIKAIKLSLKLNLFYQKNDFTQHHGHWIFTEYSKYFYNSSIMPFSIYEDSISLTGKDLFLNLNSIENSDSYRKIAKQILKELKEEYFRLKTDKINYYQLKNLISAVSLLVPLVFQINGKIYSKKFAIKQAKENFSDDSIKTVQWANEIRKKWDKLPFFKIQKIFFVTLSIVFKNRNMLQFISSKITYKLKNKDLLEIIPYKTHYIEKFIKEVHEIIY